MTCFILKAMVKPPRSGFGYSIARMKIASMRESMARQFFR
jgi:hypothetical protein